MIYFDSNSTSMLHPRVKDFVISHLDLSGNPSSSHGFGRNVRSLIEKSRTYIADYLNRPRHQVIFTSSATESNNWVLKNFPGPVFISAAEHASSRAARPDAKVIPVKSNGLVDLDALELPDCLCLLSIMHANNETGVLQDITAIKNILSKNVLWHCDVVQSFGKLPIPDADFLTFSGHKIGGLPGVGGLAFKNKKLEPFIHGGGQEFGLRSGTENILAIASLPIALEDNLAIDWSKIKTMRDEIQDFVLKEGATVFARNSERIANTICYALPGISNQLQLMQWDLAGFALGSGAACGAGINKTSDTLRAMGIAKELADCAIRISLGWQNTNADIDSFKEIFLRIAKCI